MWLIIFVYIVIAAFGAVLVLFAMHIFGVARIDYFENFNIPSAFAASTNSKTSAKECSAEQVQPVLEEQDSGGDEEKLADVSSEGEALEAASAVANSQYSKNQCLIILGGCFAVFIAMALFLNHYVFSPEIIVSEYLNFTKLFYTLVIVTAAAIIDLRLRIIPNKLVLAGLAMRGVVYILELILCTDTIKDILLNDLVGLAIGFGFLFFAGLLSRGAVGYGDAKLFAVIGISVGSLCTFGTLFFSLLFSAIFSLILLAKYRDTKLAFPFAPYILLGYLFVMATGNF